MKSIPIPAGTKDILPSEAAELRHLEARMRQVFESYGYDQVISPTLESEASLKLAGEGRLKRPFRLFDERGDVMVMRSEMTVPIARMVATKLADRRLPLRLCYFANIFRPTRPQRGRMSEFYQGGLELIGIDSAAADAEVITIICEALDACDLSDYAIGLGEVSFFRALLDNAGVDERSSQAIFSSLMGRNLVELTEVVSDLDIASDSRNAIMEVATLRGGSEVLTQAQDLIESDAMEAALKRLARTFYLVGRRGYAGRILFDFGIFRNFDYYTGVVFEVLSNGIGFPVGGGGRYNGLLAKFGRAEPAVGFAIGLDRLHAAVTNLGGVSVASRDAAVLIGGIDEAVELAAELRAAGFEVLGLPVDTSIDEARRVASENGIRYIIAPSGEEILVCEGEAEGIKIVKEHLPGKLGL